MIERMKRLPWGFICAMDKDVTFMLRVPSKCKISRNCVEVRNISAYNQKFFPQLQSEIDKIWENRLKENQRLYNGTKFRLDSVEICENKTVFKIGITCYKDFIGTNWSPKASFLASKGKEDFNNSQVYMSDALGVGAMLLSSDKHVVFQMRSLHCGEACGQWDIPGGHAEPKEIVGKKPVEDILIDSIDSKLIQNEIFDSILREVVDEVNVPLQYLSDPLLMGICRNTTSAGRPSAEFLIRCSLKSSEIRDLYLKGNQAEADESTCIKLLPLTDVLDMTVDHEMWKNMAPSCKGCISLAKEFDFDNL